MDKNANALEESINTKLADELWMEFYNKKGTGWLTVRTRSMSPLIQPRDRVLISKITAEQICCGDIAVFKRNGNLIAHRVLKKLRTSEGISFVEKGDRSRVCRLFSSDMVIGRIIMVKGDGKVYYFNSSLGRLANRTLAACLYCTFTTASKLRASSHRNIRRCGRLTSWLSLVSSNILIRSFFVIWYLSGLAYRKKHELKLTGSLTNG